MIEIKIKKENLKEKFIEFMLETPERVYILAKIITKTYQSGPELEQTNRLERQAMDAWEDKISQ